jgi:chromosome segregation ATPase
MRLIFQPGCLATVWLVLCTPGAAQTRSSVGQRIEAVESSIDKLVELEQAQALRWAAIEELLTAHEKRLSEVAKALAASRQAATDKGETVKELQDRTAGFGRELAKLRTELAAWEKRVEMLNRLLTKLRQEAVAREASAVGLKDTVNSLEAEVSTLRAQLAAKEARWERASEPERASTTQGLTAAFRERGPATSRVDDSDVRREKLQAAKEKVAAIQRLRGDVAEFVRQYDAAVRAYHATRSGSYYTPAVGTCGGGLKARGTEAGGQKQTKETKGIARS